MIMKPKIALLIILPCFLSLGIAAQEPLKETSTDSTAQEYMLEEVIVIGQRPLSSLEMEMIKAEELKYEIFNSLNSTDLFDITCDWHAPIGSRLKRWGCDVVYMKRARIEDASFFLDNLFFGRPGWFFSDHTRAVQLADKTKALNEEMITLAFERPELATAMARAQLLKQRYQAVRRKRFKDSVLIGHPAPDESNVISNEIDIWAAAFFDHSRGVMSNDVWERWDNWCRTKLQEKSYRTLWASASLSKYSVEFIVYINQIISGE